MHSKIRWMTSIGLAASLGLSACGGGGGGADSGAVVDASPRGDDAREPERTDGDVIIIPAGDEYIATQQITIRNDDGGANVGDVSLTTAVGDVSGTLSTDGYTITISLQGSGNTEDEARHALASMRIRHTDRLHSGVLALATDVVFDKLASNSGSGIVNTSVRKADISAQLPAALAYRLREHSDVGSVYAAGLNGTSAKLTVDVGDSQLAGTWTTAEVRTDVGNAAFDGDTTDLLAFTDVGDALVSLASARSAVVDAGSQVGNVEVALPVLAVDAGFDLWGATDVGTATIAVRNTQPVGTPTANEAHFRSTNFDSARVKIAVHGTSSVGSVLIHD